jgi:hypothetical protein
MTPYPITSCSVFTPTHIAQMGLETLSWSQCKRRWVEGNHGRKREVYKFIDNQEVTEGQ